MKWPLSSLLTRSLSTRRLALFAYLTARRSKVGWKPHGCGALLLSPRISQGLQLLLLSLKCKESLSNPFKTFQIL